MAFYTLLTNIGKAKLANATALGTTVQLTHIAVGDGNGAAITPVDTATVLTHEVWRAALNSIAVDPVNTNWIVAEGYIPSTSGGFTVREVGLFDIDGDLIAIGSYPDTYKPTLASGSAKDLYIKVIIEVTNSSTVTLKIDPAVVLSTRSYVDSKVVEHEAKADPHSQYLTAAKINSAIAEDPGDTDVFGFYDSFTGLLRKLTLSNLKVIIKSYIFGVFSYNNNSSSFISNTLPSGAIIEYGTNSNGEYVKYADGTLICTMNISVSDQGITSAYGTFYTGSRAWIFPHSFVNNPSTFCGKADWGTSLSWGSVRAESPTNATLSFYDYASRSSGTQMDISATAIGRWK